VNELTPFGLLGVLTVPPFLAYFAAKSDSVLGFLVMGATLCSALVVSMAGIDFMALGIAAVIITAVAFHYGNVARCRALADIENKSGAEQPQKSREKPECPS
jgi:hypothetical protein